MSITTAQIEQMEIDAGTAGDLLQAAICQIALSGEVSEATMAVLGDSERATAATYTRNTAAAECASAFADTGE